MVAQLIGGGRTITLNNRPLNIGRASGNQPPAPNFLRINDPQIDERHAVIRPNGQGGYSITALPSRNGTWIQSTSNNSETQLTPNQPSALQHGDVIRLGQTRLRYTISSSRVPPTGSHLQTGNPGGIGLGGLILVILIIAGIVYYSQNNSASTPDKTLTSFCNALKNNDYQTAYDQLASSVKSQETELQFASNLQQTFKNKGGLSDCLVGSTQQQGSTASGSVTYVFTKDPQVIHVEQLIEENGTWKISTANP